MDKTKPPIRLENWHTTGPDVNPYDAPETIRLRLVGCVHGHPTRPDGDLVETSSVREIDGRLVQTRTGSIYELGEPDPDFVRFCRENGYHDPTTPGEPIRVHPIGGDDGDGDEEPDAPGQDDAIGAGAAQGGGGGGGGEGGVGVRPAPSDPTTPETHAGG